MTYAFRFLRLFFFCSRFDRDFLKTLTAHSRFHTRFLLLILPKYRKVLIEQRGIFEFVRFELQNER